MGFYIALFITLLIAGLVYLYLVFRLCAYLRTHHEITWVALGRPSVFNNTISNNFRFAKFLFSRKYRSLDDSVLNNKGNFILVYSILILVIFFALNFVPKFETTY